MSGDIFFATFKFCFLFASRTFLAPMKVLGPWISTLIYERLPFGLAGQALNGEWVVRTCLFRTGISQSQFAGDKRGACCLGKHQQKTKTFEKFPAHKMQKPFQARASMLLCIVNRPGEADISSRGSQAPLCSERAEAMPGGSQALERGPQGRTRGQPGWG